MPIRQSAQAPIHATISLDQTPSLTVNHSMLVFTPTARGIPSYQIITLVHPDRYAPVYLSIDATEYFALATDSHPRFAASLTVTPLSLYSYVHIRYVANERGHHTGQLIIQSGGESQTISLNGQNLAILPSAPSFRSVIRRPPSRRVGLLKTKKLMAGAVLLLCAIPIFLQYMTDYQIFSGVSTANVADSSRVEAGRPLPAPVKPVNQLRAYTYHASEPTARRRKAGLLTDQGRLDRSTDEMEKPVSDRIRKPKRIVASSKTLRASDDLQESAGLNMSETAQQRPVNPLEESDLERVLNQPKHNPLN